MKKVLWFFAIGSCCILQGLAQSSWTVRNLQELTAADAIKGAITQLTAQETALLRQTTEGDLDLCAVYPEPGDPTTLDGVFGELRVRRVQLTSSGDTGLIVQGSSGCMCIGASRNCRFWLIGEKPEPTVLLEARGIQTFAFQNPSAAERAFQNPNRADHFDLILGHHDSAKVTNLRKYCFERTRDQYLWADCATIEWADDDGNALSHPRITTSRPCY